jgi:gluconate 2-dehydrogenase alpha chain
MLIDDFNGDNFDHSGLGFIGGGYILVATTGARPIQFHPIPPGTPRWGSEWKKAVARYYNRSFGISTHGGVLSYRGNYLDLDPTYRDMYGSPLIRMTFDWRENELRRAGFLTDTAVKIAHAMNPSKIAVAGIGWYGIEQKEKPKIQHYSIVPYQTTHNTGGVIMGTDPKSSAVNKYLQSWDVHNLFVVGASAYPQQAGYNPTGTVGALTYWAADAIKNKYLKKPGPLM